MQWCRIRHLAMDCVERSKYHQPARSSPVQDTELFYLRMIAIVQRFIWVSNHLLRFLVIECYVYTVVVVRLKIFCIEM